MKSPKLLTLAATAAFALVSLIPIKAASITTIIPGGDFSTGTVTIPVKDPTEDLWSWSFTLSGWDDGGTVTGNVVTTTPEGSFSKNFVQFFQLSYSGGSSIGDFTLGLDDLIDREFMWALNTIIYSDAPEFSPLTLYDSNGDAIDTGNYASYYGQRLFYNGAAQTASETAPFFSNYYGSDLYVVARNSEFEFMAVASEGAGLFYSITAVPEPSSLVLIMASGMMLLRRKR